MFPSYLTTAGRTWVLGALFAFAGLLVASCAADGDDSIGPVGLTGDPDERGTSTLRPGSGAGGAATAETLHPACGQGSCVPDDGASSCPESSSGGTQAVGGAGGALGGFGGQLGYDPGDLEDESVTCRLGLPDDCQPGDCQPIRSCGSGGFAELGAPCFAPEDCQAGSTCVGDGTAGVCRPYCCRGSEASCDDSSYCDVRDVVTEADVELRAPVCVPLDNCTLSQPYPCPDDEECNCSDGRACMVVRQDGATACAQPGEGTLGDACSGTFIGECAVGFVCSPEQGCMKLCSTLAVISGCPEAAACQRPPEFPSHLGVCVGAAAAPTVAK